MLLNLFSLIYQGSARAQIEKKLNKLELLNEWFIAVSTWHMLTFSDWVSKDETKYTMGNSMIFFILLCSFTNLFLVFKDLIHNTILLKKRILPRI